MVGAEWTAEWVSALEELELDVDRAESILSAGHVMASDVPVPSFVPPAGLGPLPPSLAERAKALLSRQLDVAASLTRAMHDSRQQIALANRFVTGTPGRPPLYVDSAC